ncbi:MAG: hypothetical protein LW630_05405 [Saprospiraceae bacterium]|nr:hypothetical protein [Saprospiraceae bacterium]
MRHFLSIALMFFTFAMFAQSDLGVKSYSTNMRKEGLITWGLALNAIDNTSLTSQTGFFDMGMSWNILPLPTTVSGDVNFGKFFSYGGGLTLSRLNQTIKQQDEKINENKSYFAFDTNVKWYYFSSSRFGFYTFAGPSVIASGGVVVGANFGIGFDTWITPQMGIRLQTMGKRHVQNEVLGRTHAQHSIGAIGTF